MLHYIPQPRLVAQPEFEHFNKVLCQQNDLFLNFY